jgi:hypothetical protein
MKKPGVYAGASCSSISISIIAGWENWNANFLEERSGVSGWSCGRFEVFGGLTAKIQRSATELGQRTSAERSPPVPWWLDRESQ